jgi:VTC domain
MDMSEKVPAVPTEVRYELKLPCDATLLPQVRSWIRLHPEGFRTSFPSRRVNNLYLDSPGLTNLAENLAGQAERRKLRMRWYGLPQHSGLVDATLELKIKRGSVGDKRRFHLPQPVSLDWPFPKFLAALRDTVNDDWRSWVQKATQPALINHYQRDYFVSPDGVIRCTLDYEQRFYDQRHSLRPNLRHALTAVDQIVVEVKAPVALEERLEQAMDSFPIPRSRHSKYVDGLLNSTF